MKLIYKIIGLVTHYCKELQMVRVTVKWSYMKSDQEQKVPKNSQDLSLKLENRIRSGHHRSNTTFPHSALRPRPPHH